MACKMFLPLWRSITSKKTHSVSNLLVSIWPWCSIIVGILLFVCDFLCFLLIILGFLLFTRRSERPIFCFLWNQFAMTMLLIGILLIYIFSFLISNKTSSRVHIFRNDETWINESVTGAMLKNQMFWSCPYDILPPRAGKFGILTQRKSSLAIH